MSNYSRGERWGSGDVNFVFDETGRVSVIFAIIDPPNSGEACRFYMEQRLGS